METVGSLLDKLSIANIRLANLNVDSPDSGGVLDQIEDLKQELDQYIESAINGELPKLEEKKFKQYYSKKDNIPEGYGFADNINGLMESNLMLWELEDERRSPETSTEDKAKAADDVSTYNQKRNQHMDEINRLFSEKISK